MLQRYFEATQQRLANVVRAPHNTSLVPEITVSLMEFELLSLGSYQPSVPQSNRPDYTGFRYFDRDRKATLEGLDVRLGTTVLHVQESTSFGNLESVVLVHSNTGKTVSNALPDPRQHEAMTGRDLLYVYLHTNGVISIVYYNRPEAIALSWHPASKIGFGSHPYPLSGDEILPSLTSPLRAKGLEQYLREPTFQTMPRLVMFFTDVYRSQLG